MKIVHIISGLGVGGAETTLLSLVRHTQNTDVIHTVICLSALAPLASDFIDAGAKVRILGMHHSRPNPGAFVRLTKWILEEEPSAVQTWMYHADLIGGIATKIANVIKRIRRTHPLPKLVWGIHRSEVPTRHSAITRYTARLCSILSRYIPDQIVCCAEAARLSHIQFGYDSEKMTVIHNGFDTAKFSPNPEMRLAMLTACHLPNDSLLIGIVGRFNPAKDYDNFLRAAAIAATRLPHARFLMVGKDVDNSNHTLCERIEELGLTDKVTLLGPRRDVVQLMPAFDFLCLSSRTEGFPTVVGEAMASGTPCVATNVGDTALLVGETGIIVPPADSTALGLALEKMGLATYEKRAEYSMHARRRIIENFSIKSCWDRYFRIYSENKSRIR